MHKKYIYVKKKKQIDDPEVDNLPTYGNPMKLDGYDDPPTRPKAPDIDEHRAQILAMLDNNFDDGRRSKL